MRVTITKESEGLGDTIEKITIFTGVKRLVEKVSEVTGRPCGCHERKEILNKKYPYGKD